MRSTPNQTRHPFLILALLLPIPAAAAEPDGVYWPGFRGPGACGIAEGAALPVQWNTEKNENIRWKTAVPGLAHSCPVIWGDRVFLTTAVSQQPDPQLKVGLYGDIGSVDENTPHRWQVLCLDKRTGEVMWKKTAREGVPTIKRHPKATHANATPATDGKHVVAFFGSEGLYCFDMAGKLRWKKDLGRLDSGYFRVPEAQWGFGASPVIHDGLVIVQCDVQTGSFLAAFRVDDGEEVWRTPRDDVPTWSTPTVHFGAGRGQVIVNGYKHIGGYELATGKALWNLTGGGDIPIPTPVVAHGLVFITNAHGRAAPIYAIRLGATGDITLPSGASASPQIAWSVSRGGAYMQTPLVYGDYLYNCRNNGVLSCYRAKTGERVYQQRLSTSRTGFTASPVAGDGKLYFTSETGTILVVRAGPEYMLLARNEMGEICMATPALSEGTLFVRTQRHLFAIADAR